MTMKLQIKTCRVTGRHLYRRQCTVCNWPHNGDGAWSDSDAETAHTCSKCNSDGVERPPVDLHIPGLLAQKASTR